MQLSELEVLLRLLASGRDELVTTVGGAHLLPERGKVVQVLQLVLLQDERAAHLKLLLLELGAVHD